jgi:chemotaxis protein CheC
MGQGIGKGRGVVKRPDIFSELELDALREIMNIGFGQAAGALSEVIDLHVVLSVPKISVVASEDIASFIGEELDAPIAYSLVEQFFFGGFEGASFFLLPEEEGRKLAGIFGGLSLEEIQDYEIGSLERETVKEIGNIIIGACVGKIAEMLRDQVQFQPPRYFTAAIDRDLISKHFSMGTSFALVFKTIFHFESRDISGFLFLIASERSMKWMKRAVVEFTRGLG